MDALSWLLLLICSLAGLATAIGMISLAKGNKSKATLSLMIIVFISECAFLYLRGEQRGKCPLGDWGEILMFIAWSLTMFYLVIGSTYRVSLLGFFSAPFVFIFAAICLIPGVLEKNVVREAGDALTVDYWGELHSALAVLSYGSFALAMIVAVMFLALNKKLKDKTLSGGLFNNLPPIHTLTVLCNRLLWLGLVILTAGIMSSFLMEDFSSHQSHLWTAIAVWLVYLIFLTYKLLSGMQPKTFAIACCLIFFGSLIPFALL